MKASSIILLILFTLSSLTILNAQDDSRRFMGFGISLDPARIGYVDHYISGLGEPIYSSSTSPILFYIPIDVSSNFRLEPSFGFFTSSRNNVTSSQSGYYSETTADIASITIGIRGTYISQLSNSVSLYVGPRLDFSFVSLSIVSYSQTSFPPPNTAYRFKTSTKETDAIIGIVFGAEYYPISQFSIGGEVSLNYLTFGNPEVTREQSPPPSPPQTTYKSERKQHMYRTDALFFLRWFFLQVAQ